MERQDLLPLVKPRAIDPFRLLATAALLAANPSPPAGATVAPPGPPKPYRITRGDRLTVSILGEPELKVAGARVEPVGTVNLILIKEISLAGLTISEAEAAVASAYRERRFIRNPLVTLTVDEPAPRTVIISGKVIVQGRQDIPPGTELTIKDVIFRAGGFAETARGSAVRVTRVSPEGKREQFILDVESGIKGRAGSNGTDAAFVLEPGDVVYVPEKFI